MTGPVDSFNRPLGSRVLVRVVRYPLEVRGEVLAVYIDSRTMTDPDEVVYSFARGEFRVEPHRRLMQRTRPATDTQTAEAQARMTEIGERVTVLRRGLRYVAKQQQHVDDETADEAPADGNKDDPDDW